MTVRANLYYLQDVPDLSVLAATVGTPASGAPQPREGAPGKPMALMVGDVLIELERFAAADLPAHLDALRACLADGYDVLDAAFPPRLAEVRCAVTVTLDRGRPGAAGERYLNAMAAATNAIVLDEEGVFRDAAGRVVAVPVGEAGVGEDDGAEGSPPPPEPLSRDRVAKRALALAALAWRAFLDQGKPVGGAADLAIAHAWLEAHAVFEEMDGPEQALVRAPFGSWSENQIMNGGWCVEAASVLAWALHLAELPAHDTQASPEQLQRALGLFAASPAALTAEIRNASEIDDVTARLFAIMSRLLDVDASRGALDFVAFAQGVCPGGFDLTGVPLAGGDLALAGAPISTAPEQAVLTAQSIAVERFRAADWLQGGDFASSTGTARPAR